MTFTVMIIRQSPGDDLILGAFTFTLPRKENPVYSSKSGELYDKTEASFEKTSFSFANFTETNYSCGSETSKHG
jgi:hypothetical protein